MKKIEDKNMEVANMKDTLDSQVRKGEELQAFLSEKEDRICVLESRNNELVLEGESKAEKVRASITCACTCIFDIFHNDIFFGFYCDHFNMVKNKTIFFHISMHVKLYITVEDM